jgi:hypothetical protein
VEVASAETALMRHACRSGSTWLRRTPREGGITPGREQFTKLLKSTSTLPGLGDEPDEVPDGVVDWSARHVAKLVPVLDSVFRKA